MSTCDEDFHLIVYAAVEQYTHAPETGSEELLALLLGAETQDKCGACSTTVNQLVDVFVKAQHSYSHARALSAASKLATLTTGHVERKAAYSKICAAIRVMITRPHDDI
jgi:hypothetical protein